MSLIADLQSIPPRISSAVHRYASLRPMPGPPAHPVFGHLRQMQPEELADQLLAWSKRYGSVYRCRIFHRPVVVVADPALVREVLRSRPHKVRRLGTMEPILTEIGINGVFSAEGEDWRRQRRLVMSAFGRSKVADMQTMVATVTERLLTQWERNVGSRRDVLRDLTRFTADVTTLVAFGYDLDSLRTPAELQRAVDTVFDVIARRLYAPVPHWRWFKLPRDHEVDRALASLRSTVQEILQDEEPGGPDNLLRRLRQARLQEGSRRGLSEPELFANVMTLLFAGEDTTSNTLAWLLHFLADHPQVQERIRQEVDEVLGDETTVTDPEAAGRLRRLEAAFLETLRLRPVAPVMFLQTREPLSLGRYELPADTQMFVILGCGARSAERFTDPDAFVPERWLDDKIDLARPAEGLHPFGGGPRVCPGRGLALLEVQTLVGSLLRRYEVHRAPDAPPPKTVAHFTWGPDRVELILRPRMS